MTFDESKPRIPRTEYPQRWRSVQSLMAQQGLDLLIAYADDRATYGAAHARWLADFPVHFESVCVLFRQEGLPILLCGPESDEYARLVGSISDVRVLREFTHPDEEYKYSVIESLAEILTAGFGDLKAIHKVGVAGRSLMSVDLLTAFQSTLSAAEWLDVEKDVSMLRAVKSPAEAAVIRYAYQIAQIGMQAAIDAVKVGVTEREVAAEAESAMRRAGAEGTGIDTIVASGPHARSILGRSTFRKIESGDLVVLTVAPRYEGYHGAIGRPVFVGKVDAEARRAFDVALAAQKACSALLSPAIEGRKVDALGRQIVGDAGLGQYYLYTGVHSVGVIEFESPIFNAQNPTILQPNMFLSIDIPMFNAPWGGLRIEDGFLIMESGAESLHHTPYLIEK
jgi:Xaa-Pro aminopeptidase